MPLVAVDDAPDVVAVVPTMANNGMRLKQCLDSLAEGSGALRLAVVCVMNTSSDLGGDLGYPLVAVIQAGINLGWAGGLAFGATRSDAPLIWFVQDDMTVDEATLEILAEALASDDALGAVGPLVVGADGRVPSGSCGAVLAETGNVTAAIPVSPCLPEDLPDLSGLSYVPSRGLLVRRQAFTAVDGPNPRLYPVQWVDVDFCLRLRAQHWTVRLVPLARVRHEINGSSPPGFVHFLHSRNAEFVAQTWLGEDVHPVEPFFPVARYRPDPATARRLPLHPEIPLELSTAVAQSAADTLTHLGRVFSARESARDEELAQAHAALDALYQRLTSVERSRWWRMTAPLRRSLDALRRIAPRRS